VVVGFDPEPYMYFFFEKPKKIILNRMVPEVPPKSKTRPNDGDKSSKQPNSKYNNSKNLYKCDYPLLPIYNYKTEKIKEV